MSAHTEKLTRDIAKAVGAGEAVAVETVDFSDPNRPKTCLEVDFPILPINQVATIEGNAGKPIYQMSKWWARRRSSVFRSMLLAAAMKAPDDPGEAAKKVWDLYYANHQKKGSLKHLKVADIFMGGGTTMVEGSRLGMQMHGVDLNPVAWLVVKNELARVERAEVDALLTDIEKEVRAQIMPFYACKCPRGHSGKWRNLRSDMLMSGDFDPLQLTVEERKDYRYEGPEIIYVFWAKHGPCQVRECGNRTPIMSSPIMAVKTFSVKAWEDYSCRSCKRLFDVEKGNSRMAPSVPLAVADSEKPFAPYTPKNGVKCPHCHHVELLPVLQGNGKSKKISLALLIHPQWLAGSSRFAQDGTEFGGSATDSAVSTEKWNRERASKIRLLEVRGELPDEVTCPESGMTFSTSHGTVPKRSNFACGACGTVQDILTAVRATGKTGPLAAYAIQGYCPDCDRLGETYGGRFFSPLTNTAAFDAANFEWETRKDGDLKAFWPRSEVPYGFMTHMNNGGIANHGFTHWWTMFHSRQLLVLSLLLKATSLSSGERHKWETREFVLGAYQQYLRNQNLFCFWDIGYDKLVPHMSNNNYHPKANIVENAVFPNLGRGNWKSCTESLRESPEWATNPWEVLSSSKLLEIRPELKSLIGAGKSQKVIIGDPVRPPMSLSCGSATDLTEYATASIDLVITDPPFGGLLHYSELADFFYVWLRLALKERYPKFFGPEYTPKTLEVVANRARQPEDPDKFYQRLLTACWRESHRILKEGGILAFTFHHSEDEPWISVLESLFEAGFYLEAVYPIRSDETKGEGSKPGTFGSQKIEFDMVHVCRKRTEEPKPVSWARLRRQILQETRRLQTLLENHKREGLPEADLAVIRRGKALEFFSKHYGQVFIEDGQPMLVKDAMTGINQVLDQEGGTLQDPPPGNSTPFTWQFCRMFDQRVQLPRDQMQKYLRGSGYAANEYENAGWCAESDKVYHLVNPVEFARQWRGRHRSGMLADYDQAMYLIGACFDGSGINVNDTLNNPNFKPHPALGGLLEWFGRRGGSIQIRNAGIRARQIYGLWLTRNQELGRQLNLGFYGDAEDTA